MHTHRILLFLLLTITRPCIASEKPDPVKIQESFFKSLSRLIFNDNYEDNLTPIQNMLRSHPTLALTKNNDGTTPLWYACHIGSDCLALQLLKCKADVNAICRRKTDEYPLHWAGCRGHTSLVFILLEHKAITDVYNKEKKTPLHHSALWGHAAIVKTLLLHNANPTIDTAPNAFLYHYCALSNDGEPTSNHTLIAQLFLAAGARQKKPHDAECSLAQKKELCFGCKEQGFLIQQQKIVTSMTAFVEALPPLPHNLQTLIADYLEMPHAVDIARLSRITRQRNEKIKIFEWMHQHDA